MRPSLIFVLLAIVGCGSPSDQIELALDFQPNAAHAGIYSTPDLDIRAPSSSIDSTKLLASGAVDLAIVDIQDLGLARERGEDIVGIGAIVQRPLAAVIADPSVRHARDLEGKRVGISGLPSDEAVLRAVVEGDGGDYDRVETITIGFSAVPALTSGKVDAVVAFWNAEGVALERAGVPTREFRLDATGISYPELILAARGETAREDPARLRAAVAALADGTRAALADPDEATERIAAASDAAPELVAAQLEAISPAFEPVLELDRRDLDSWADFAAGSGILERRPVLEELFPMFGSPDPDQG
ncbi:MAG: ABC transporter substrate-binding protein [Thermoleophilaceae bacterium]|nr:ABC transporter substrate-binding protein [Thermoleophilaceae bacterium]